jgi:type III restriction enzyme, res subunit family
MKGTKYLSELVDCSALQKGQLNVIKAPTGSGKTYFALNYIPSLTNDALHNVVYLIDTINGKEQIVRNYKATSEYYGWSKEVELGGMWFEPDNRVVVITYAKFGVLVEQNIEFYKNFSYIICDEIHSLLRFQNYSKKPNYHSIARQVLEQAVKQKSGIVIALTATPDTIKNQFNAPSAEIAINQEELIQYDIKQVEGYTNPITVLSKVDVGTVGLCYFSRIHQMIEFEQEAKQMGFSPVSIWSINNKDHPMNDEQLETRRSILESWTIPPQYDLLIINSSSETSLKIKSKVDYVIVHSSNPDTQVQVRGRINSDLMTLYLPVEGVSEIVVPSEYLGKRLFQGDKQALAEALNLRNTNNRPYRWPTVKNLLIESDYSVIEARQGNLRYVVIEPSDDG